MSDDQQQISVDQQINSLKKQLEIELKVKTGAESILNTYTGQRKDTYRKMCEEAQIVLKDAKAKADYLRMQIKRLENGNRILLSSNIIATSSQVPMIFPSLHWQMPQPMNKIQFNNEFMRLKNN